MIYILESWGPSISCIHVISKGGIKKKMKYSSAGTFLAKLMRGMAGPNPSLQRVHSLTQSMIWAYKKFPSYSKNLSLFLLVIIFIESHMNYQTLLLSAWGNGIFYLLWMNKKTDSCRPPLIPTTFTATPSDQATFGSRQMFYLTHINGSCHEFTVFRMPS